MNRVLIIGGCGRIGSSIARDITEHTSAEVTITGRNPQRGMAALERLGESVQFQVLDLTHHEQVREAIAKADVVVHSAGPFHHRQAEVLKTCIDLGVNYVDVSDERQFTQKALAQHEAAEAAGVTAIINTGVFPGMSNSMARQGIEQFDHADSVQLSYIVAGSGGAGVTVMRTTFIGLQHPFQAWIDGQWREVKPYTAREALDFPSPYGRAHVYWYDMPEAVTLQQSFSLKSVVTKFGVVPDFYNHATWTMAHWLPPIVLKQPATVEFLAKVSHWMTDVTDRFSGQGVAMRCDVRGDRQGQPAHYCATFTHKSAAIATGQGTGSIAELILAGKIHQSGVYPVEKALSTDLFQAVMERRHLTVQETFQELTQV